MKPLALITGGQRGIGFGIANALKVAGFNIAILAEQADTTSEVQAACAELGDQTLYVQHDLKNIAAISDMIDHIENEMGPITCLVNNAGVPAVLRGDMLDIQPDNFDHVLDINVRGGFFLSQEVARRMLSRSASHYQSMIFITSVSAEMVSVERAEYCISKAAASMMTRLFSTRLAEADIGVFELRPGIIETDMTAGVKDKYDSLISSGLVPQRRWGQPADIAQVSVALATGQLGFSTGAVIPVDGGLSISQL
ncbi:MAG: 3-ketoacyl-ACP reductase [Candidatus Puniceispirillaceae bacterium]